MFFGAPPPSFHLAIAASLDLPLIRITFLLVFLGPPTPSLLTQRQPLSVSRIRKYFLAGRDFFFFQRVFLYGEAAILSPLFLLSVRSEGCDTISNRADYRGCSATFPPSACVLPLNLCGPIFSCRSFTPSFSMLPTSGLMTLPPPWSREEPPAVHFFHILRFLTSFFGASL